MKASTRRRPMAGIVVLAALAAAGGLYVVLRSGSATNVARSETARAARYHCPMHPTMVSDRPGDCPICGMRLVPIEEDGAGGADATPSAGGEQSADAGPTPQTTKKIIYRSTMNPSEVSTQPGKDSMGMDMVPEEVEEASAAIASVEGRAPVKLSAAKRQLIGVRTTVVGRRPFVREIRTVGRVTYDETRLHHVHTKIAGWVERLYANATGEMVTKGAPLLTIYSPELVSSAQEYLIALQARDRLSRAGSASASESALALLESARRRLLLFGLTPQQIAALEKNPQAPTNMTLHAPITGHIIARNVTQGQKIDPDQNLLDIADLSRVWVLADIYEYEVPYIHLGQTASMTLSYLPGRTFHGQVTLIYPVLSAATRTVKARLEFANPDFVLRPEMYAEVEIRSDLGARLAVPESAVIGTGTRDIVFVELDAGSFAPREVKLGMRLPDGFEVLEGLSEGEQVVVSGNFLMDSESKLKAALAAAEGVAPTAAPEHAH